MVGISLTDYDGNPDFTTAITVGQTGQSLTVEPVSSGPSNRDFYVSVPGSATLSATTTVVLSANIPATGSGTGSGSVQKQANHVIDAVVPIDHRAAAPTGPSAEQSLPHP